MPADFSKLVVPHSGSMEMYRMRLLGVAGLASLVICVAAVSCSEETPVTAGDGGKAATTTTSAGGDPSGGAGGTGGAGGVGGGAGGGDGGGGESHASPGCDGGAGLDEGEHSFVLDDYDRRYVLHLPNGYDPSVPWPVVLALHGNGGSLENWNGTDPDSPTNIRTVLEDDAVLVLAEAMDGQWRDYSADPSTWPARIELELAYFEHVLNEVTGALCIDEASIFAMGFSGGGSFSGVLGCRRDDIRAIAVGGSVIYFEPGECIGTPAAWVAISDGDLSDDRLAYLDFFRERAGCDDTTSATEPPPCVAYSGCGATTPVHFCQHPGGHQWPDFGSQAMWDFFAALR